MNREWGSLILLKGLVAIILAFGLSRSLFLTIVMGGYFKELAEKNIVRTEVLVPVRGVISDRTGKPLVMNIENDRQVVRFYPAGEMAAAITGYVGSMSEGDLDNCHEDCLVEIGVGKAGLEKAYDGKLRGTPGEVVVEESAGGDVSKEIIRVESVSGENISTNIDLELQKELFVALKTALESSGKSGVAVAARVNGEVLALVSLPSYDPNLFIAGGKRSDYGGEFKDVADLIGDEEKKPLFNRAVSGEFAPGSVYKLVPALAALAEGKIEKSTLIADTGEIVIGEYRFGNWYLDKYGRIEGDINVEKALSRSNDVFFYRVGERLGVDLLSSWSSKLSLGESTGIDLPGESLGLVPTQYWKEKNMGTKWFLGDTYHMSIGQGNLMSTPIQINRMTSSVVSSWKCKLKLVGKEFCEDLKLQDEDRLVVLDGMMAACSDGGTAYPLFDYGGKIYCKTGTAQHGGEKDEPHAWVSVVVPKGDDPRNWIVLTVLIESGGEGSAVAAPVAAEVMPYLMGM